MNRTFFLFLALLFSSALFAQNKKALKYFNEARSLFSEGRMEESLELLNKAIDKDPEFADPALMAGQICSQQGDIDRANTYFNKAWGAGGKAYVAFQSGIINYKAGEYERALTFLQAYIQHEDARDNYLDAANKAIDDCEFAIEAMKNPSDFQPKNMGPNVNSPAMEYFPAISADGKTLVFTYRDPEGKRRDEDFYYTEEVEGEWTISMPLEGQLNTPYNEGAQCVTADGQQLIFVGCNRPEGKGSCDLYTAFRRKDGQWSRAINLGDSINSANWETQPSISPDGRTLYFIRAKKREPEESDIYFSELKEEGYWTKARKMPDPINSEGREASPFIHFDNQTFYFCSDGRTGMGNTDFYVSRKQDDGSWSEPENLGYPINGPGEELGLVIAADGKTAYYSSDMDGGEGSLDLYHFEVPEKYRAIPSAWIKGLITDMETGKALQADLVFTDLNTGEELLRTKSHKNGRYFAVLPGNSDYALSVEKATYLFHSENFALQTQSKETAFQLDVQLQALKSGSIIALRNVFFATSSFELRETSFTELDRLVQVLMNNPELKVSLEGHTDNEGSPSSNQKLSENRAKAVHDYLISKGVLKSRLQFKGFGEQKPIASNETEEGRQRNRRTELRIL